VPLPKDARTGAGGVTSRPRTPRAAAGDVSRAEPYIPDWLELTPHLSAFDRNLIRLLQLDGRRSFTQLANDLGVAQKTVRRRLRELEESGAVRITTVGDPYLLGYNVIANVGVRVDSSRDVSEVAQELAAQRRSFYVAVVTGRYNIFVEVSCIDHDDLLRTVERDIARVKGVLSYEIHPYMLLQYQNPSYEASWEKPASDQPPKAARRTFDAIDREIIARLSEQGRVPYQTIARALGISDSQVRQRLRRMVASGAVRVMAMTMPAAVGFETVALIGIKTTPGQSVTELAASLSRLPAVIYVAITGGRYQLHVEVVCSDAEDLLALLDGQLRSLPGVASAEPWTYLRLHYRPVRPIGPGDLGASASPTPPAQAVTPRLLA
jgi:DNA-binding Lrp family transcriptional regulator